MTREFKLNDKVTWLGLKGIVMGLGRSKVCVRFDYGHSLWFLSDGRYCDGQRPSLKHRRFRKKAKRVEEIWVNIFPRSEVFSTPFGAYPTEQHAKTRSDADALETAVRFVRADPNRLMSAEELGQVRVRGLTVDQIGKLMDFYILKTGKDPKASL